MNCAYCHWFFPSSELTSPPMLTATSDLDACTTCAISNTQVPVTLEAVPSHYLSEYLVCDEESSLLPASTISRAGKFRYHRFARHVANALQKVINNTSLLDYCSSTGTMKLITTAILLFASSTLAVSVKVIRHGTLQPIPASSANAMLQVRCVKQECQCTGWDVNSCSGPGCGQQCNTGG